MCLSKKQTLLGNRVILHKFLMCNDPFTEDLESSSGSTRRGEDFWGRDQTRVWRKAPGFPPWHFTGSWQRREPRSIRESLIYSSRAPCHTANVRDWRDSRDVWDGWKHPEPERMMCDHLTHQALSPRAAMASQYDAIIIGAGHNGLVAACYLARAGWKVLVLERRHLVGGACVTEEVFPGFKVSTAAYVISLFRPEIVRDLRLDAYGLRVLERIPSSFTPFPNGRFLLLGTDPDLDQREIAKFSVRDADTYPRYQDWLEGLAAVLEPLLTVTPPNVCRPGPRDLWRLLKLGRMLTRAGAR